MKMRIVSFIAAAIVFLSSSSSPAVNITPQNASEPDVGTSFSDMLARAEAIVNYTWTPSRRIATWNDNPYNGKNYFEAGETVVGMPYTLFSWELGVDSLLSLEQYDNIAANNYSVTAYCNSMNAERTGPVYGSCCATFVSEVFGGEFINGLNPRYDSVYGIKNSSFGTTLYGVTAGDIRPGDALSNTSGGHIIWVGGVTDEFLTIYEQTPPVARKRTVELSSVDDKGYLVYNGSVYSTVTRSNEIDAVPEPKDELFNEYCPIKGYPCTDSNFEVTKKDRTTRCGEIYTSDYCTIDSVYADGWCKVTFPLTSTGGTLTGYTPISNFIYGHDHVKTAYHTDERIQVYPKKELSEALSWWIGAGDTFYAFGKYGSAIQVLYPVSDAYGGGYKIGWIDESELLHCSHDILYGDVNDDGVVNSYDRFILTRYLACMKGYRTINMLAADVNLDGKVSPEDRMILARFLSGWSAYSELPHVVNR